VTGGCGFIGSHLCAALRASGHQVRVLDDLSTGRAEYLAPGAELLRGNIADPDLVRGAIAEVDGCFHLAAIASVERGVHEWLPTHRVNLGGTVTLLDAIAARGDGRRIPFVYASSAAVYGDQAEMPIRETAPCRPLSAYGADKLGSELHARVGAAVHGIPSIGLRFFNVFGPRQDAASPYSGVISIFCDRIARAAPVTIYGDGAQTRDFVHVGDVVAALRAAMRRLEGDRGPRAEIFNVCTGRAVSVRVLAETIARAAGQTLRCEHAPARAGEIRHSIGSPDALRGALGVGEPAPLAEGLADVLAWLRESGADAGPVRKSGSPDE
jgi:UDP-glucose 4-epimerase